ncbi:hypothetical protein Ciccas_005017 [Cichlidogyrus casuarinus]|uniref:Uncharacterized protein n=1 Tax=Cichlidogyrus casuarinus TaxID=1844966 RepID=A0ABD2Q9V6_9PLAT
MTESDSTANLITSADSAIEVDISTKTTSSSAQQQKFVTIFDNLANFLEQKQQLHLNQQLQSLDSRDLQLQSDQLFPRKSATKTAIDSVASTRPATTATTPRKPLTSSVLRKPSSVGIVDTTTTNTTVKKATISQAKPNDASSNGTAVSSRKNSVSTVTSTTRLASIATPKAIDPKRSIALASARKLSQQTDASNPVRKASLISAERRGTTIGRTALTENASNGVTRPRKSISSQPGTGESAAVKILEKKLQTVHASFTKAEKENALSIAAFALTIQWQTRNEERLATQLTQCQADVISKVSLLEKTRHFAEAECAKLAARAEAAQGESLHLRSEQEELVRCHMQEVEELNRRQDRKINHVIEQYETDREHYYSEKEQELASLRVEHEQLLQQIEAKHLEKVQTLEQLLKSEIESEFHLLKYFAFLLFFICNHHSSLSVSNWLIIDFCDHFSDSTNWIAKCDLETICILFQPFVIVSIATCRSITVFFLLLFPKSRAAVSIL